jgi:hypothetical protein
LDQGVISERILPYTTLIMPLSAMFADIIDRKGEAQAGAAWAKIAQWYWCSVFSQRYSSQTESAAAQDIEQVMAWVDGAGPEPDVVHTFTFRAEALQEITSIRNAVYKGVLCLLAREGARDFGGGAALTTALFFDERHDHHHIFPSEALRRLGIADPRADSILNKTLISAAVNRSIGGSMPSQYLARLATKLGEPLLDGLLQSHAISPAALRQDDWPTFAQDRRERLRALVLKACGGAVRAFGAPAQASDDMLLALDANTEDEEELGA